MTPGAARPHPGAPPAEARRAAVVRRATAVLVAGLLAGCSTGTAAGQTAPPAPATSRPAPARPSAAGTPAPEPEPAPVPAVRVPLAAPTHVTIPQLGIDADVEEYTDADVAAAGGWVDPPHRDTVAWWSGGGTPGDPADNTVYLYGHVSRLSAVFNALAGAAAGQTIVLTTAAGALTYQVTRVLPPVPKEDLPTTPEVAAAVPGRLVLIGCHRDPDQGSRPTTKNTVVIAEQMPDA